MARKIVVGDLVEINRDIYQFISRGPYNLYTTPTLIKSTLRGIVIDQVSDGCIIFFGQSKESNIPVMAWQVLTSIGRIKFRDYEAIILTKTSFQKSVYLILNKKLDLKLIDVIKEKRKPHYANLVEQSNIKADRQSKIK